MDNEDEGGTIPLDPGFMGTVTASELEVNQMTVSLRPTHLGEDIGGGNESLTTTREVDGVKCIEMGTDLVPVCVEKRR